MATLSNTAMAIAGGLLIFVLLTGPTFYVMSGITGSIGDYFSRAVPHGFRTYTFFDEKITTWFQSWTLTFMVWWFAWAPFVGVFIARISKGRTIREYILGVILVPTFFSIFWFGVFGSVGFFEVLKLDASILEVVKTNINDATFFVLRYLPLSTWTIIATVLAAFLFVVTSVVSAAFVLSMFAMGGDLNPPTGTKLMWGAVLGALGLVMILSNSIDAVKSIIGLAALPFIFIVLLVTVCLLKALKSEVV
jgi:glycine betaine transporter